MDDALAPKESKNVLVVSYLALLAAGGIALRLLLSAALRRQATSPGSPLVWVFGAAAVAAAGVVLWAFVRVWRRRDNWPLYLGASLLFILLYKLGKFRPELASLELPLAIFALAPAAVLVWAFVRQVRGADELQRQILFEALAISFVVEFAVAIVYALLEGLGIPRPPSIFWASLLVISWSVGLAIRSARYERE